MVWKDMETVKKFSKSFQKKLFSEKKLMGLGRDILITMLCALANNVIGFKGIQPTIDSRGVDVWQR